MEFEFSVIIPTFNRATVLPEALESVLDQKGSVQLIVIDDGSDDDTSRIVGDYGGGILYVRLPRGGAAAARNHGISLATGRHISFLDSDDIWLPGKLEAEKEYFRQFPEADAVVSDSEEWHEQTLHSPSWFSSRGGIEHGRLPDFMGSWCVSWARTSIAATGAFTVKREALAKLGCPPFETGMASCEDWDFEIRLFYSCRTLLVPEIFTRVRRFDDGSREERKNAHSRMRFAVLQRAMSLPGWCPEAVTSLESRKIEVAADLEAEGNEIPSTPEIPVPADMKLRVV